MKKLLTATALSATLAAPALAQEITGFNIGILGGENAQDRLTNQECYRAAIEKELGVPVKVFTPADYDGVIQGLLGGTLDMAWLGASGYAKIHLTDENAVEVVLTKQNVDGSTGYYTIALARKDSGITDIKQAEGKRLGYADPDSTSGYLVPMTALPATLGKKPEEFFASTDFGGGHENLVLGVLDGTWDAGTTFGSGVGEWAEGYTTGNLHTMVEKGILDTDDIVELWRSPQIPNGPLMVSNKLPEDLKAKVQAFFLELPTKDLACFQGFTQGENTAYVEVEPSFYDTIVAARKSVIGD